MLHRPGVLGKLRRAQSARFLDAGHRSGIGVGAVFLVAEDRQPFLERKLEPVAAGDAVAGPVVKVLVGDDAIDVDVVAVGRGIRARQHVLGVEDIEALVLHRAGVEVAHRHDLVLVEVELEPEAFLVPGDGALQAVHGPVGLLELARLHVDRQLFILVFALQDFEICGHQGEEIRGLRERVHEPRPVPLALGPRGDKIAVGEKDRVFPAVRAHRRRIARHHVGPVDEPGDAAEALGLALGDEAVLRRIEAFELRVLLRHDARHRFEGERIRHIVHGECFRRDVVARGRRVHAHRDELELVAVEHQRAFTQASDGQLSLNKGVIFSNVDVELDGRDTECGRSVVLEVNRLGVGFAHARILSAARPRLAPATDIREQRSRQTTGHPPAALGPAFAERCLREPYSGEVTPCSRARERVSRTRSRTCLRTAL